MAGDRRLAVGVAVAIDCQDDRGSDCVLKMSVRNHFVSLRADGGDEWAHLTSAQARRLADWLVRGADEADARRGFELERFAAWRKKGGLDGR